MLLNRPPFVAVGLLKNPAICFSSSVELSGLVGRTLFNLMQTGREPQAPGPVFAHLLWVGRQEKVKDRGLCADKDSNEH